MKKLQRGIKNKIMVAVLMVVMLFGMNTIPVDAAAVTTAIVSAASGHTLYVRESGSITVLGTMYLQRKSGSISNTFTASKTCIEAIVFVSSKERSVAGPSVQMILVFLVIFFIIVSIAENFTAELSAIIYDSKEH